MDFLDSLKQIKKELEKKQKVELRKSILVPNRSTSLERNGKNSARIEQAKISPNTADIEMQEIFLKEEKLRDEFENFIKDSNIKKIF